KSRIMYQLSFYLFTILVLSCNSTRQNTMSKTNVTMNGEWISLFDGKTTNGWHTYGKKTIGKAWKVEDGVLRLDAASKKDWQTAEGGDIITDEEFEDFHLKLDWKISPKGNSGIIFYIHEDPAKYKYPWETGPEMQVLDNGTATTEGHPDGKITSHRAGDLYDLVVAKEAVKPAGEWNAVEIISKNGDLEFRMNGQEVLKTNIWDENWKQMVAKSKFKSMPGFGIYKKGKIGLQDHGDDVWFRNIMIRRL
ncbi:MAG TPA: DUF1080 domain-containing protein, partial [Flavisolibacter sp.]